VLAHLLVTLVVAADTLGALLVLGALPTASGVVLRAGSAGHEAVRVPGELGGERAWRLARAGAYLLGASSVVLVAAWASAFPALVPGAMCGTGVTEAMAGHGGRALALRALALGLLGAWHLLDRFRAREAAARLDSSPKAAAVGSASAAWTARRVRCCSPARWLCLLLGRARVGCWRSAAGQASIAARRSMVVGARAIPGLALP
jgi:hypothetical protein